MVFRLMSLHRIARVRLRTVEPVGKLLESSFNRIRMSDPVVNHCVKGIFQEPRWELPLDAGKSFSQGSAELFPLRMNPATLWAEALPHEQS